jgi:hypothetical protein
MRKHLETQVQLYRNAMEPLLNGSRGMFRLPEATFERLHIELRASLSNVASNILAPSVKRAVSDTLQAIDRFDEIPPSQAGSRQRVAKRIDESLTSLLRHLDGREESGDRN